MANSKLVPRFYQSVIEDVISNLQDVFVEEGIDDQILKDLKQLWENKILHSKAVEGLDSENNHQKIMLDLQKQNTHQTVHTLTASIVVPAGRSMQNFTTAEMGTSGTATTLTLPSGISLPIQVPAGVTLQTASGLMYKVNVPVMVTQSAGGQKYFQQPVHHIIHQVTPVAGQTSLLQQSTVSGQTAAVQKPSHDQAATIQQSSSGQVSSQQQLMTNQSFDVVSQSIFQQPGMSTQLYIQQAGAVKQVVFQQHPGMKVQMRPPTVQNQPVGTQGTVTQQQQRVPTQPSGPGQAVHEQMSIGQTQQPVTSDLDRITSGQPLAQNQASEQKEGVNVYVPEQRVIQQLSPQVNETLLMVTADPEEEEHVSPIPQMDGTNDTSSDEEIGNLRDVEDTDILGIIDVEDLKALESYDDDSSSDNSLRDGHNEEHHEEVEEDPLNSEDDVSEQEIPDLFETDNVIVCQYDKIHRNKNRWKFYLKDGIMTFNGRDYVFSKAVGDAEW